MTYQTCWVQIFPDGTVYLDWRWPDTGSMLVKTKVEDVPEHIMEKVAVMRMLKPGERLADIGHRPLNGDVFFIYY